jgi:hypothetical protein
MNGKTCLTPRRVPVQHLVKSSGEQRDRELDTSLESSARVTPEDISGIVAAARLQSLSQSPVQNFENWHLHQVEKVELWTEENHRPHPVQEVHSDSSKQVLSKSCSKEAGHFGKLAGGVSMLEETEVAMQVKAATKIQAIARVRARKQEKEKALKASHARVQSCDNSKEARIKSEQTMIMSDTLITDSEFSKMLSSGPSVRDSTFHDSHAEDNWRNRDASCVHNLIYL